MQHDFEDIEVKRNAPDILAAQLQKRRKPCMISTGSMCDHYIPLETELQLTRQCLQVIEKHGFGVNILTKSDLILRDLDVLKAINAATKCVVQMTLTTANEALCRIIEPNVATTARRLEVLHAMGQADIPTVVWLSPFLPFINDTEENLRALLKACVDAGVRGFVAFGFGVTLRQGDREYFYAALDKHFPGLKQRYIDTYGNAYSCHSPNQARLWTLYDDVCRRHNLLCRPDDAFGFLQAFEPRQLSLLDG